MLVYREFGSIALGFAAVVAAVCAAAVHCCWLLLQWFRAASRGAQVGYLWGSLVLLLVLPAVAVTSSVSAAGSSEPALHPLAAALCGALPLLLASAIVTRVVSRAGA